MNRLLNCSVSSLFILVSYEFRSMLTQHVLLCCAIVLYTAAALPSYLNLTLGQVCNRKGSRISTCKSIKDCPKAVNDVKTTGKQVSVCHFEDEHPVICCEPDEPGTKSKQMCKQYATSVYAHYPYDVGDGYYAVDLCASNEVLLFLGIGENEVVPREFPHTALIGYNSRNSKEWLCDGSLISERFVLSAAHCTILDKYKARWVLLGEYNKNTKDDDNKGYAQPTVYEIVQRINHPQYKAPSLYHDIALYRLDRDVVFNEYIRPICLQTDRTLSEPWAVSTSWRHWITTVKDSPMLQKVNVTLMPEQRCDAYFNTIYESRRILKSGILDVSMICATGNDRHSCEYASGGPLQLKLQDPYCMYSQVGVSSLNKGCTDRPRVYTRVSHYISWIEKYVWP